MAIRLLHTADIHLDWLYEKFPPRARERRRQEIKERFGQLVDLAIERDVSALLVAGDFLHGEGISESSFNYCLHQLERLNQAGIWTLIATGNHDPMEHGSYWKRRRFPERVKIFSADTWESFETIPGLTIYGISFAHHQREERILARLPKEFKETVKIALVHSQVLEGKAGDEYYPIAEADVVDSGLDYLALGHVHRARAWSWGLTCVVYPGSLSRLTFKNSGERSVELLTIENGDLSTTRIVLPDREFRTETFDLTKLGPDGVYNALTAMADPELCLRIQLQGISVKGGEFFAEGLARDTSGLFFHLEIIDQTVFLPENVEEETTVKGIFLRSLAERFADPSLDDDERQKLNYALQYGLAALKGGGRR